MGPVRLSLVQYFADLFPHRLTGVAAARFFWHVCAHARFILAYRTAPLGMAAFYANDEAAHVAYLTLIAVAREAQGQHVGSHLLQRAEEIAITQGMTSMKLEVRLDNVIARTFYQKYGYCETGRVTTRQGLYMVKDLSF